MEEVCIQITVGNCDRKNLRKEQHIRDIAKEFSLIMSIISSCSGRWTASGITENS